MKKIFIFIFLLLLNSTLVYSQFSDGSGTITMTSAAGFNGEYGGFSNTSGGSFSNYGYSFLKYELVKYEYNWVKAIVKETEIEVTPNPCGTYFCCNIVVGGLIRGVRYVDLSCGWGASPSGFKEHIDRTIGIGRNRSGRIIDLPYIWYQAYSASFLVRRYYTIETTTGKITKYTYEIEFGGYSGHNINLGDVSTSSVNEVFQKLYSLEEYQTTSYTSYGIFKFSINNSTTPPQLEIEVSLPSGVHVVTFPLNELVESGVEGPYSVEFEIQDNVPLLFIRGSNDKYLILILDDIFLLSSKEFTKLIDPRVAIVDITYNLIAPKGISSEVETYIQDQLSGCGLTLKIKTNYFRGIHPKIYKFGNPLGIKP